MDSNKVQNAYNSAREIYADFGVYTDNVIKRLDEIVISLHCWQTDDVGGFEKPGSSLEGGGIQVTGNYPGKARNVSEVRQDLEKVISLLPGKQRVNLHASYGEFEGRFVDRDEIEVKHYRGWIDWAKNFTAGLDFNPTCFSHQKADGGFTLSSMDSSIRNFWIEHVKRCREIASEIGGELKSPCINNIWVPDGSKDITVNSYIYRSLLKESLDEILKTEYPAQTLKDSVESKLFGIGSEFMVVGSYDFYISYALKNNIILCLDNGHFHPTEIVSDKISACLQFFDELMLHVTRGIRWDSDHIVILSDETVQIAKEIVRAGALGRVNIGLDFFDATLNRAGAYVIGARAIQQAFMIAMLEPLDTLKSYENEGRFFERLSLLEIMKTMPFGAVWDYYCMINDIPVGIEYVKEIQSYESGVLSRR